MEQANRHGPVFVVGMNGSGTTMLADSLGKHPELYMLRLEAKVLPYFLQRAPRYGDLGALPARRKLARDIGRAKAFWQVNGQRPLELSDAQLARPGFAGVVRAVFEELAGREGKRRWGEKSPMNLPHIAALGQAFPDAQFIHIIRDAREAAQSFHRRYGYAPLDTVYRWKKLVSMGREQGAALGPQRYAEVLYEDLTRDPEAHMRRLCQFLGMPYSEHVVESSMRMVDQSLAGGQQRIIENSGKWRDYFSDEQVRAMERVCGRCLAQLGYEVADASGDEEVSRWLRRWWAVRDRVTGSVRFFRHWGWQGLPAFWRAVRAAIMQGRVNKV